MVGPSTSMAFRRCLRALRDKRELNIKGVSPLAARADASSFCGDKRNQKRSCRDGARRVAPGSLRCSVRVGSAELAPVACAPYAQTCSGPVSTRPCASRRHRGRFKAAPVPLCRLGLDPGSSVFRGVFQRPSSRLEAGVIRIEESSPVGGGLRAKSSRGRTRSRASAFQQVPPSAGRPLTCPAVSAAEKRRGERTKAKRCLSGAPQARSEFFWPRSHRASQGTRPPAGRRCSRSAFGYFWRTKSTSPSAREAGGRNAFGVVRNVRTPPDEGLGERDESTVPSEEMTRPSSLTPRP
jgi:hypothetical protein